MKLPKISNVICLAGVNYVGSILLYTFSYIAGTKWLKVYTKSNILNLCKSGSRKNVSVTQNGKAHIIKYMKAFSVSSLMSVDIKYLLIRLILQKKT